MLSYALPSRRDVRIALEDVARDDCMRTGGLEGSLNALAFRE